MSGFSEAMRKYASFRGRARRREFWEIFFLSGMLGIFALIAFDGSWAFIDAKSASWVRAILMVTLVLVPVLAAGARRLHDVGRSGWLLLWLPVPPVNLSILLHWCQDSSPGPNQYGPNPKEGLAAAVAPVLPAAVPAPAPSPPLLSKAALPAAPAVAVAKSSRRWLPLAGGWAALLMVVLVGYYLTRLVATPGPEPAAERADPVHIPAGTVFRDKLKDGSDGPEMVVIAAGSFTMGSPESEADRTEDEGPQHQVTLQGFAAGRTEVTVAQFRAFATASGYRTDAEQNADGNAGCFTVSGDSFEYQAGTSWTSPGFTQDDSHPAVCLSWNDAKAYIEWLAQQTGKRYRLPSEAEQEYLIRAGSSGRFAWGSNADSACGFANVGDQSAQQQFSGWTIVNCTDGHVFTSPAGSFTANAFGLADTVGNVWEWAEDCWNESYGAAPTDGTAWTGGDCSGRVLRGAGWSVLPVNLRAAYRAWNARAHRDGYTGLRLVQDL